MEGSTLGMFPLTEIALGSTTTFPFAVTLTEPPTAFAVVCKFSSLLAFPITNPLPVDTIVICPPTPGLPMALITVFTVGLRINV